MPKTRARYPGKCARCDGEIKVGDEINSDHGEWYHVDCDEFDHSDREEETRYWKDLYKQKCREYDDLDIDYYKLRKEYDRVTNRRGRRAAA